MFKGAIRDMRYLVWMDGVCDTYLLLKNDTLKTKNGTITLIEFDEDNKVVGRKDFKVKLCAEGNNFRTMPLSFVYDMFEPLYAELKFDCSCEYIFRCPTDLLLLFGTYRLYNPAFPLMTSILFEELGSLPKQFTLTGKSFGKEKVLALAIKYVLNNNLQGCEHNIWKGTNVMLMENEEDISAERRAIIDREDITFNNLCNMVYAGDVESRKYSVAYIPSNIPDELHSNTPILEPWTFQDSANSNNKSTKTAKISSASHNNDKNNVEGTKILSKPKEILDTSTPTENTSTPTENTSTPEIEDKTPEIEDTSNYTGNTETCGPNYIIDIAKDIIHSPNCELIKSKKKGQILSQLYGEPEPGKYKVCKKCLADKVGVYEQIIDHAEPSKIEAIQLLVGNNATAISSKDIQKYNRENYKAGLIEMNSCDYSIQDNIVHIKVLSSQLIKVLDKLEICYKIDGYVVDIFTIAGAWRFNYVDYPIKLYHMNRNKPNIGWYHLQPGIYDSPIEAIEFIVNHDNNRVKHILESLLKGYI